MEPVRIKAYGFVNVTKVQYLSFQGLIFLSIILMFTLGVFVSLDEIFFKYATYLFIAVALGEVVETAVMLYKFKQKEKANLEIQNPKE